MDVSIDGRRTLFHFFISETSRDIKKIFCFPALELFHCLPLWKTVLFVISRDFSLSTLFFLLSTPVDNSEATWKKDTKCNKLGLLQAVITEHCHFLQDH